MTKSYNGLERDNSKPRRGRFLNNFLTSSIHAVCFCNCYFNFNLRNPRKILKNEISRHPVDQPLADLDQEKQHEKVIQRNEEQEEK